MNLDSTLKNILNALSGLDQLSEFDEIFDPLGLGKRSFENSDNQLKDDIRKKRIAIYTALTMDIDGKLQNLYICIDYMW